MYKCRERRMRRNGLLTPLTYVHAGEVRTASIMFA
jgi:hypothetical protein